MPRSALSGACWFLSSERGARSRCGQFTRLNGDETVLHLVRILEQAALWWPRSTRSILIISPTMTRAHKQAGLLKPSNRPTEVRAVNRKNLELLAFDGPHLACRGRLLAIVGGHLGIPEGTQTRLAFWEFAHRPEW